MRRSRIVDWKADLVEPPPAGSTHKPIKIITSPSTIEEIRRARKIKGLEWPECRNFEDTGIVFQDEYILVVRDPVQFPNGKLGTYLRVFERAGVEGSAGSVVLPTVGKSVCFVQTYRHTTQSWELELPRGWREPEESPETAAARELEEETGLIATKLVSLGSIHPNSGLLTTSVELFFAECAPASQAPHGDDAEAANSVQLIPFLELKELINSGKIKDAFSISALLFATIKGMIAF